MENLVQLARLFAIAAHKAVGQKRKYTGGHQHLNSKCGSIATIQNICFQRAMGAPWIVPE